MDFVSGPTLPVEKTSKAGWVSLIYKVAAGFHQTEMAQKGSKTRPDQGLEGKEETLETGHDCWEK